jgi:2-polyprenyl-3-methyl-5-hydroxy-6-metoxy-1,4-benzoquinol methylase
VFDERSAEPEFLDRPDFDPRLAARSYRFMGFVNRLLGGRRVVRRFVAAEMKTRLDRSLRILDIGAGQCDIPRAVSRWARGRGRQVQFTCLEINDTAFGIARQKIARANDPNVRVLKENIWKHHPEQPYDWAIGSMFFHHLSNEQIIDLLRHLRPFVTEGVLINDLRRCPAIYAVGAVLTAPLGREPRFDALASIRRGFRADELRMLLEKLEDVSVFARNAWIGRVAATVRFRRPKGTVPLTERK